MPVKPANRRARLPLHLGLLVVVLLAGCGLPAWLPGSARQPPSGDSVALPGGRPTPLPADEILSESPVAEAAAPEPLLAAQNLEYAPTLDDLDIAAFLRDQDSPLADMTVTWEGETLPVPEVIGAIAERHAVNPRVLLAVMELRSGAVSQPAAETLARAAGYPPELAPTLGEQLDLLAETLATAFVDAFMGQPSEVTANLEGFVVRLPIEAAPATYALSAALAETTSVSAFARDHAQSTAGFVEIYSGWFGDPRDIPVFARNLSLPIGSRLPYAGPGRYTGAPHTGGICSHQQVAEASGLDFGGGSFEVLSIAEGRYLGHGQRLGPGLQAGLYVTVEHPGGVQSSYWHLASFSPEVLALEPGQWIPAGFPLGRAGNSGNQSSIHLHVELRVGGHAGNPYSGVRVSWDGQVLDDWTIRMARLPGRPDVGISYRGSAVRGPERTQLVSNITCGQSSADMPVGTAYPADAQAANGRDPNTGFANYPDSANLVSSNVRNPRPQARHARTFVQPIEGYYLLRTDDARVVEVSLNGQTLFEPPYCARAMWLRPGQYTLSTRYDGREVGTPEVRLEAWPFDSPDCAAPPIGEPPTEGPAPLPDYDEVTLLAEAVPPSVPPGALATLTWRVRNTGTRAWGPGYRLAFVGGSSLGGLVSLPPLAPGQEGTLALALTAPERAGRSVGYWQLRNDQGVSFGPLLRAEVVVGALEAGSAAGTCEVEALPETSPEPAIPVRWHTSGDPSARYSIQFREEDDGPWRDWLLAVPASEPAQALFRGLPGQRYAFRCLHPDGTPSGEVATRVRAPDAAGAWWHNGYAQRVGLVLLNDTGAPLPAGSLVRLRFDGSTVPTAAELYDASAATPRGHDLRIIYQHRAEIDRHLAVWDRTEVEIVFRTRANLAAGAADTASYALYWGNAAAGAPPDALDPAPPPEHRAAVAPGWPAARSAGGVPHLVAASLEAHHDAEGALLLRAAVRNDGDGEASAPFAVSLHAGPPQPGSGEDSIVHAWLLASLPAGAERALTARLVDPAVLAGAPGGSLGATGEAAAELYLQVDATGSAGDPDVLDAPTPVCLAAADAYEPDGDPDSALWLRLGRLQRRNHHAPGAHDWVRLRADEGVHYVIETEHLGPRADTVLELYAADGQTRLAYGDDRGDGGGARLVWRAPATGSYLLRVRPWHPDVYGCGTAYTLLLQTDPPTNVGPADGGTLWLPLLGRP